MQVPVAFKIAGLTVAATAFYMYVGQLVPQSEVHPPAEIEELSADVTTEEMVAIGRQIFEGKGLCVTCHTVGESVPNLRFPDLDGIAVTADQRVPGMSALEYLAESLYEPDAFIVPGFAGGMPAANRPPVSLSDQEIRTVIAFLQTLGGEATITLETALPYGEGAAPAEPGRGELPEPAAESPPLPGVEDPLPPEEEGPSPVGDVDAEISAVSSAVSGPVLLTLGFRVGGGARAAYLRPHVRTGGAR